MKDGSQRGSEITREQLVRVKDGNLQYIPQGERQKKVCDLEAARAVTLRL